VKARIATNNSVPLKLLLEIQYEAEKSKTYEQEHFENIHEHLANIDSNIQHLMEKIEKAGNFAAKWMEQYGQQVEHLTNIKMSPLPKASAVAHYPPTELKALLPGQEPPELPALPAGKDAAIHSTLGSLGVVGIKNKETGIVVPIKELPDWLKACGMELKPTEGVSKKMVELVEKFPKFGEMYDCLYDGQPEQSLAFVCDVLKYSWKVGEGKLFEAAVKGAQAVKNEAHLKKAFNYLEPIPSAHPTFADLGVKYLQDIETNLAYDIHFIVENEPIPDKAMKLSQDEKLVAKAELEPEWAEKFVCQVGEEKIPLPDMIKVWKGEPAVDTLKQMFGKPKVPTPEEVYKEGKKEVGAVMSKVQKAVKEATVKQGQIAKPDKQKFISSSAEVAKLLETYKLTHGFTHYVIEGKEHEYKLEKGVLMHFHKGWAGNPVQKLVEFILITPPPGGQQVYVHHAGGGKTGEMNLHYILQQLQKGECV
jgi:hypothetical protein